MTLILSLALGGYVAGFLLGRLVVGLTVRRLLRGRFTTWDEYLKRGCTPGVAWGSRKRKVASFIKERKKT